MKLKNISAIITGASQGLGLEIARHFVREGASVAICARDATRLAGAKASLEGIAGIGQKVFSQAADVSRPAEVQAFCSAALAALGSAQVLINNAGVYGPKGPVESVDWEAWTSAIAINLYGMVLPCRALIPHFKTQGRGKIINLSGGGATAPLPFISAYAASKAAVVRMTETLAEELREAKVDVNAVAPGALNTRMLEEVIEAGPGVVGASFHKKALKQKDEGGASPESAAELCAFLASAESDGITGKLISAVWDPWRNLPVYREELTRSDIYTLRRIVPGDRGQKWE